MATAQIQKTNTQEKSWAQIFPNEQITEQKSALFVKKLLAVAISSVTYLRAIFPEQAFGDKCLEDLNLKILRDETSCPGASQVIKWVKGCFDALDKKYLKTLVIGIYNNPDDPETVLESYTFRFAYNDGNGEIDIYRNSKKISSAHAPEDTKKATVKLLRTIILLTHTLSPLPDNVMMTMKLYYYDDVTPADYEPPGFRASKGENFLFAEETTTVAVGHVNTPFHGIKMRLKTSKKEFEMDDETAENLDMGMEEDSQRISNDGLDCESRTNSQQAQEISIEGTALEHITSNGDANSLKSCGENEFKVRCPCGCNEDDGLMVWCENCKFWQHGVCFLITDEYKAPQNHICDVCAKPGSNDLEPTDPHLCGMSSIAIQATCLWRRALMACTEFKRLVAPQLARRLGIETTVAQGLLNRLHKEGYLTNANRGSKIGKIVEIDKIEKEGIPRYLQTPKYLCKKAVHDEKKTEEPAEILGGRRPTEEPSKSEKNLENPVDDLTEQANQISLKETRKSKRISQKTPDTTVTVGKGKKRVFSHVGKGEFEVANSQEVKKGKASRVTKDIAI